MVNDLLTSKWYMQHLLPSLKDSHPGVLRVKRLWKKKKSSHFTCSRPWNAAISFFFLTSQSPKEVCDGSVKSYFHCIVYRLSWRVFKSFFLEVYSMFPEREVLFRNVRGPEGWPDSQCCHQSNFKCTVLYFQPIFYFYFYFFFSSTLFTVEGVVCVVASHLGDLTPLAALTLDRLFNLNSNDLFIPSQHITWNQKIKFKNVIYRVVVVFLFSLFASFSIFCTVIFFFLYDFWRMFEQQPKQNVRLVQRYTIIEIK